MKTGRVIRFDLQVATPLLNVTLRQHWARRRRKDKGLAWAIKVAILEGKQAIPAEPFQRARVTIVRRSLGAPDRDNLVGGVKGLVDCLLHPGPVRIVDGKPRCLHPNGLGIVQDDDPERLELIVRAERVRSRAEQGTAVTIEELLHG